MKKLLLTILLILIILAGINAEPQLTVGDLLRLAPAAVKTAVPIAMLVDTITDPAQIIYAGVGVLAYGIPNALLIYNVFQKNQRATKILRTISIFTDGGATVLLAGYGALLFTNLINTGAGTDDIVGMLFIGLSFPMAMFTIIDFSPYSFEK